MNNVSASNLAQAMEWLSQGKQVALQDNQFICSGWKDRIRLFFDRNGELSEIKNTLDVVKKNLKAESEKFGSNNTIWLNLSYFIIKNYSHNRNVSKVIALFDREIVSFRDEVAFVHPKNQAALKKWKGYGMPENLYQRHPEFCTFLETTGLLSQIKVTRDVPQELDREAALKVNGELMKWSEFKNTFESFYSPNYRETFIVKKDTREVYTYLDNGKGLQQHHPYLTEMSPVSTLNEEEYQEVLQSAYCFIRPEEAELTKEERSAKNENRAFIIQIVSSQTEGSESRASHLLFRAKHPYLRLIVGRDNPALNIKKGEVYEVGYMLKNKISLPLVATQGQFRSPDLYEYKTFKEKIVTNVPVSREEAFAFYKYTQHYFRDSVYLGNSIGFHFIHQNCSTYVRAALQMAGITVPTEMSLSDLLYMIAPDWIRNIGKALQEGMQIAKMGGKRTFALLPKQVQSSCQFTVAKVVAFVTGIFEAMAAFCLVPVKASLGSNQGNGGVAFAQKPGSKDVIQPELKKWKAWFRFSRYKFNLPGVLQQWQREQLSTIISHNPVKLTILPFSSK